MTSGGNNFNDFLENQLLFMHFVACFSEVGFLFSCLNFFVAPLGAPGAWGTPIEPTKPTGDDGRCSQGETS